MNSVIMISLKIALNKLQFKYEDNQNIAFKYRSVKIRR